MQPANQPPPTTLSRAQATPRETVAGGPTPTVNLAKYPYPYRAMIAICSDLDETPDRRVYYEIVRFLNTTQNTAIGPGVGLEVGNSIFFLMPDDQFSYVGTDDAGRDMVRAIIHSGHIDCLHSYGDHAQTRHHVELILAELDKHACKLKVWVDHSKAPTNFGPDIMQGTGDIVSSPAYHADLTSNYGIHYVWRGRTTSITGQNRAVTTRGLTNILDGRHPFASARTMAKQAVKIWLGRFAHQKWDMHAANRVCRTSTLRDGRLVWEFIRSNPYWGGPGFGDTAAMIAAVLTPKMLHTLLRTEGVCILYTHLGKVRDAQCPFDEPTRLAFGRLAALHRAGKIQVTTTYRLLRYLSVRDHVRFEVSRQAQHMMVFIRSVEDPVIGTYRPTLDDLIGLTFVVNHCDRVSVCLPDGKTAGCDIVRTADMTIASVPWRPLVLQDLS
jgi:hypothetical protein